MGNFWTTLGTIAIDDGVCWMKLVTGQFERK